MILMAVIAAAITLGTSPARAEEDEASAGNQTRCPVMGGKINRDIYADHEGQRVYFCCNGCPEQFLAAPEHYLDILRKRGETPEAAPSEPPATETDEDAGDTEDQGDDGSGGGGHGGGGGGGGHGSGGGGCCG